MIPRLRCGWLAGALGIDRSLLVADCDAACGGVDVEAFVFVEVAADAGQRLAETSFGQKIADGEPRLVEADVQALLACRHLRGIRRLIQGEVNPRFESNPISLPEYGGSPRMT